MSQPTFTTPDIDTFCMVDALGVTVTGQQIHHDRAILECRLTADDPWCRDCGGEGVPRGTVIRKPGALATGLAADHPVGAGAPVPVQRLRPRLAARHH